MRSWYSLSFLALEARDEPVLEFEEILEVPMRSPEEFPQ